MKKTFYSTLLATAFLPLAAMAQDATTPPPAAETPGAMAPADSSAGQTGSDTGAMTPAPAGDTGAAAPVPGNDTGASEPATDTGTEAAAPATDDAAPMDTAQSGGGANETFVTVPPTGAWRASDLEGKDVYDAGGEDIGDISDTLVDEQGKVIAVLVGVGGFLGIGEKDVAVSMSALEFGPGATEGLPKASDVAATTGAAGTATPGAATGTGVATTTGTGGAATPVVGEDNLPDHIVLNVTRDQLEQAPAYEDPSDAGSATDTGATGGAMGTGGAMDTGTAGGTTAPAQ